MRIPRWGRKGNYSYACARVKAKKKFLLSKDNYPKLLMMDLNEIGRFLGETQYKVEMAALASKWDGVNLIELGTSRNLARVYTEILGFTKGDLREMVASYLGRWDAWNIKTILRGKYYGASVDEIKEDLVAAGSISEETLNRLVSLENVQEVLEALKGMETIQLSEELISSVERTGTLAQIEDYLDKVYYERLLSKIDRRSKAGKEFYSYVAREIDVLNVMTLLKCKRENLSADRITGFFVPGGEEIDQKEFIRLATVEGMDKLLSELSNLRMFSENKEGLEAFRRTGSLAEISLALQRYTLESSEKFSRLYPLSVLPILDFIIRKKVEVDNIRIIARGKESGMDPELIKRLLVI
ncbi:MAG: ATP synthase A1 subunit C [Methanomassiliicoccales archaeon]